MKNACLEFGRTFLAVSVLCAAVMSSAQASPGGHGGGGSSRSSSSPPAPQPPAGGGGEGFGASPKALSGWEAAGGRAGTGLSFQDWFRKQRADFDARQDALTWEAKKAGWGASAWTIPYVGAQAANYAGKAAQFGLNFVPGVGKAANLGLDAARGAADGYSTGVDQGLSQSQAARAGAKTGVASGLMSALFNRFGANAGQAISKVQKARTATQIARTNKALTPALVGTGTQEGIKEFIGSQHANSVVNNSAPQAQLTQD